MNTTHLLAEQLLLSQLLLLLLLADEELAHLKHEDTHTRTMTLVNT